MNALTTVPAGINAFGQPGFGFTGFPEETIGDLAQCNSR